jgi:hypothetical protein
MYVILTILTISRSMLTMPVYPQCQYVVNRAIYCKFPPTTSLSTIFGSQSEVFDVSSLFRFSSIYVSLYIHFFSWTYCCGRYWAVVQCHLLLWEILSGCTVPFTAVGDIERLYSAIYCCGKHWAVVQCHLLLSVRTEFTACIFNTIIPLTKV